MVTQPRRYLRPSLSILWVNLHIQKNVSYYLNRMELIHCSRISCQFEIVRYKKGLIKPHFMNKVWNNAISPPLPEVLQERVPRTTEIRGCTACTTAPRISALPQNPGTIRHVTFPYTTVSYWIPKDSWTRPTYEFGLEKISPGRSSGIIPNLFAIYAIAWNKQTNGRRR
jgi:hypothetical protein